MNEAEVEKEKMEEATTTQNPLEIPEVLEMVYGYLPLKDLKSSRLVNKRWNVWALSAMKKMPNPTVKLRSFEKLAALLAWLETIPGGTSNFPCSKFKFEFEWIYSDDYTEYLWNDYRVADADVLFSDFLLKISSWVTELTWETDRIEHKTIFETVFPRKVEFPNLKVLRLVRRKCEHHLPFPKSLGNFNLLVANILEKAPSLKKLSLEISPRDNRFNLLVQPKISFFTELELSGYFSKSDLKSLSTWHREVKLNSVSLNFERVPHNGTDIFHFLSTQSTSLEELKLDFNRHACPWINKNSTVVTFPQMPNLKILSIKLVTEELMSFPGISYARQFPALNTLHFHHFSEYNYLDLMFPDTFQQLLNSEMEPVVSLEELTLPSHLTSIVPLTSALEAGIFPNVKILGVEAHAEVLRSVIHHLPDLEVLTLDCRHSCGSIDFMLTGHNNLEIKTIKRRIRREGNAFQWNQLELGNANQSIAALQKLRILRFKTDLHVKCLEVSRVSLHLILTKMSLKCIDFGARNYPMETKIDRAWCEQRNKDCVLLWNHERKLDYKPALKYQKEMYSDSD